MQNDASRKRNRIGAGQLGESQASGSAPGGWEPQQQQQQQTGSELQLQQQDQPVTFEQITALADKFMNQNKQAYKDTKALLDKVQGGNMAKLKRIFIPIELHAQASHVSRPDSLEMAGDSGAEAHILGGKGLHFARNIHTLPEPIILETANGETEITQSCTVTCGGIILHDVLMCPPATSSLISTGLLATQGWTFTQAPASCTLLSPTGSLYTLYKKRGLHYLGGAMAPTWTSQVAAWREASASSAELHTECKTRFSFPASSGDETQWKSSASRSWHQDSWWFNKDLHWRTQWWETREPYNHSSSAADSAATSRIACNADSPNTETFSEKFQALAAQKFELLVLEHGDQQHLAAPRSETDSNDMAILTLPDGVRLQPDAVLPCTADLQHWIRGHFPYDPRCDICIRTKLQARPARRNPEDPEPGQVSGDLAGPLPKSLAGNIYALALVIRRSRLGLTDTLKNKKAATIQQSMANCKLHQRSLWRFHSDQGSEFANECQQWLNESGLLTTDTGGHRPQANSIVERRFRELFQMVRALLLQAGPLELLKPCWDEAYMHANDIINTTEREIPGYETKLTPFEIEYPEAALPDIKLWPP